MKASKLSYLLAVAVAFTFVATGCKKRPTPLTDLPGRAARVPSEPPPANPFPQTGQPTSRPGDDVTGHPLPTSYENLDDFNQDRSKLAANMVHFAFDSSVIRSSEQANVQAVATYMRGAPGNEGLLVEGHCDERGTEEYNRALGERRALAVREALISLGVDSQRITTRSYGKDKPADLGHDEAAWAKNRRCEFVVLTPK